MPEPEQQGQGLLHFFGPFAAVLFSPCAQGDAQAHSRMLGVSCVADLIKGSTLRTPKSALQEKAKDQHLANLGRRALMLALLF